MYTVIRIVIMLILFLIVSIMYGKDIIKFENKKKRVFVIIIFVMFGAFLSIPFENYIMDFQTPVAAFNYKFFDKNIIKIVEDKDNAYIVYGIDKSSVSYTVLEKRNNSWKLTNPFIPNKVKFEIYEMYTIITIQAPNNNQKMIIITEGFSRTANGNAKISDNQKSDFITFFNKHENSDNYTVFYYTIIDSQIKDYQLSIDNKVIGNVNDL